MRRPDGPNLFHKVEVWHDRAPALVYGTALGAWMFPISYILLILLPPDAHWLAVLTERYSRR